VIVNCSNSKLSFCFSNSIDSFSVGVTNSVNPFARLDKPITAGAIAPPIDSFKSSHALESFVNVPPVVFPIASA
jgi:hypothetical protein